jgi:hypothetical protein
LLSACFFALGVGTLLPWSTSVVTLPWLAAASRHAPAPPAALAASLLGALTLSFSACNTLTVLAIARFDLAARLPPRWQVPVPLAACAAVQAAAAAAAHADAGDVPLAGSLLVAMALPAALLQGVLTAFINCGSAAMAASRPARVMRAYTSGQALAGASRRAAFAARASASCLFACFRWRTLLSCVSQACLRPRLRCWRR